MQTEVTLILNQPLFYVLELFEQLFNFFQSLGNLYVFRINKKKIDGINWDNADKY